MASNFFKPFASGLFRAGTVLCALGAFGVFANTVLPRPDGGGQWYTGVTPNENPNDAFWDSPSRDDPSAGGIGCNVGYWLGGQTAPSWGQLLYHCRNDGNVSNQNYGFKTPRPLAFYASATTGDNPNGAAKPVGWDLVATDPHYIDMSVEVAGWRAGNVLGYYTADSDGTQGSRQLNVIYNGVVNPVGAQVFTINPNVGSFGFFLCANAGTINGCNASNMVFSGDPYTSAAGRAGKFALFSETPSAPGPGSELQKYWVGVEDVARWDAVEGVGDYNDIIFSATVASRVVNTPETSFYFILATDLAGLLLLVYFFSHRRRLVRQEGS